MSSLPHRGPRRSGGHQAAADSFTFLLSRRLCDNGWHSRTLSARASYPGLDLARKPRRRLCYKVRVRREFSAGGVVVRQLRGRPVMAAIRPAGKPEGTRALPKGLIGPGERAELTALREVGEGTGVEATPVEELRGNPDRLNPAG